MRVNLLFSKRSEAIVLVLGYYLGGGNSGSTAIFKAFSIICGIIRASKGELNSKHGFVFTSISQT